MEWHEQRTLLEAARSALYDLRCISTSEIPVTDKNDAARELKLQINSIMLAAKRNRSSFNADWYANIEEIDEQCNRIIKTEL